VTPIAFRAIRGDSFPEQTKKRAESSQTQAEFAKRGLMKPSQTRGSDVPREASMT
jgi:hypothetical protein